MPLKVLKITHLKPSPSFYEGETKAQGQSVALPTSNQKSHAPGPLWRCLLFSSKFFALQGQVTPEWTSSWIGIFSLVESWCHVTNCKEY